MKSRINGDWPKGHTFTGHRIFTPTARIEDTTLVDLPGMRELLNLQFMLKLRGFPFASKVARHNLMSDIEDARFRIRKALYESS